MGQSSTTSSSQTTAVPQSGTRLWQIILISAAVAFYWASLYFYVPTLSVYVQDKTNDLATVGVVVSMYGLWQAILRLPLGIVTDWMGRRKPFLLAGFALSALGAWVLASSSSAPGLITGRAITGLAAATWVPLVVIFSSLFPPHEAVRATALLSMINSLSRVIATSLNGRLNEMGGYELAFYVSIAIAGLAILVTLPVHEKPRAPKQPSLRSIGVLITRKDVLLPAVLSAVAQYIAWSTTFGFIPVLARNLGANADGNSLLMSMYLLLSMAGNLLTSFVVRRIGNQRLFFVSFTLTCLGVMLAGLASSLPVIFLIQAALGFASGMVYPLLMGMSIEKVSDGERATAMGLHQAVYAIGMFAGPWLSGMLADQYGIQPMFIATGAACLVVGITAGRFLRST
jgi:MFS family permease